MAQPNPTITGDKEESQFASQNSQSSQSVGMTAPSGANNAAGGPAGALNPDTTPDSADTNLGAAVTCGANQSVASGATSLINSNSVINSNADTSNSVSAGDSVFSVNSTNWLDSGASNGPSWDLTSKQSYPSGWGDFPPSFSVGTPTSTSAPAWGSTSPGRNSQAPSTGTSSWGVSSAQSSGWGAPSTTAATQPTGTDSWGSSASAPTTVWGEETSEANRQSAVGATGSKSNGASGTTSSAAAGSMTWAATAAKGLPNPKTPTKTPEVNDPLQQQIESVINNPEGWGKKPIRQDAAWGNPPPQKNPEDSNTWQATPNNGTAIWEASKNGGSSSASEDKSLWNQKVAGNNDPNVWNGEGSKGKDNALWDNVPKHKEKETGVEPAWKSGGPVQSRTISQSSGGENGSEGGWSGGNRTSPQGWGPGAPPGPAPTGWLANGPPYRSNSVTETPNWNDAKPGGYWAEPEPNEWENQSKFGGNWDESNENRPRPRNFKSESDTTAGPGWSDADMGDWNENTSYWSSASGFKNKPPRQHSTIPENGISHNSMKIRGPTMNNNYAGPNQTKMQMIEHLVSMGFERSESQRALISHDMNMQNAINYLQMNSSGGGMNSGGGGMNSGGGGGMYDRSASMTGGGQINSGHYGANEFNPNVPPPNMNNQYYGNKMRGGPMSGPGGQRPIHPSGPAGMNSGGMNSGGMNPGAMNPAAMSGPSISAPGMGRGLPQNQTRLIVSQLQQGVQLGLINPNALMLPINEQTSRHIQHLLQLVQQYSQQNEQLMAAQRSGMVQGPQLSASRNKLAQLRQRVNMIQQNLLQNQNNMRGGGMASESIPDMGGLNLGGPTASGSRLSKWVNEDKAPGNNRQQNSIPHTHSTPNLQGGGVLGDLNPWSNHSALGGNNWTGSNQPYMDNDNPSNPNAASFDIPEFVPGQPWAGATAPTKHDDDPTIIPGIPMGGPGGSLGGPGGGLGGPGGGLGGPGGPGVSRSLSVNTASSGGLGWGSGGGRGNAGGTWSSGGGGGGMGHTLSPVSAGMLSGMGSEMWKQPTTRPPPGLRGSSINRSKSMPQGPSDKSAFSPVVSMSGWDTHQENVWIVLRNLTPQIDSATLKTLCQQHGPLQQFVVNQSSGQALLKYTSKHEGEKAQKSLNSCVLGNTTIIAEFVDDVEARRIIEMIKPNSMPSTRQIPSSLWSSQSSSLWGNPPTTTWGSMDKSSAAPNPSADYPLAADYSM